MENLAEELETPRHYIGLSAFVCFGLLKKLRVHVWLGENRVDILNVFTEVNCADFSEPPCDAVATRISHKGLHHVSEQTPMSMVNHWVVAEPFRLGGRPVRGDCGTFYNDLGYSIVETVADGDCGFDAMIAMLGGKVHGKVASRSALRREVAAFVREHKHDAAIQTCMAQLEEVNLNEDPEKSRPSQAAMSEKEKQEVIGNEKPRTLDLE